MGIELEWFILLAICAAGNSVFGRFEAETAWWRKLLKWTIVASVTYLLYCWVGHRTLWLIAVLSVLGLIIHFGWCRRNGIHPFRATPRRRYYELRGWRWPE